MIRRGRPDDADTVAAIFRAARVDEMPYLPALPPAAELRRAFVDRLLAEAEVWVAEAGGRVVGFAALENAMLGHLYVLPEAQGRGVGNALLDHAKQRRPEGFSLWTFQRNTRARAFYERRGFELVELTDGFANMEREPDALYRWRGVSPEPEPAS